MGVSNAWGATIDNISDVWMEGSMNSWTTKPMNWKFSKAASNDNNHYIGTFYIPYSSTKYEFKIRCAGSGWTDGSLFAIGGYWFTSSNYDFTKNMPNKDVGNDLIECISTTSGYIKLDCEFWGSYSSNSRLVIKQSAVEDLSPSLSANKTALIAADKSTITASCSGGSGSYTYTYKVTCDGSDVTNSTLSATTGASVTFTAPSVTGKKTYTITVTAKDSHALLSGLATKTATQTITVYESQYILRGSTVADDSNTGGMAGWDATNNNAYTVITEGTTMTIVATLTNAKTQYKFKIYNNFDGSFYGQTGNSEIPNNESWTLNGSNDVKFTTTAAGPYTFIYNTSNKSIKVQYPTAYTVTYSRVPTSAANAPTTEPSFSSGDYVLANTSVTFTAQAANTGYTWKGWYSNNSGTGDALSSNQSYTRSITANTTIYAVYTANTYTVNLNQEEATEQGTSSVTATYDAAMPKIDELPARTGYTFGGYYTEKNGGGTQYYKADGTSAKNWKIASNSTLYAKWTPINYTIRYNTNGGNSIANKTYTIETATFDLPTPTKTGYTFDGWYTKSDFTDTKVTQIVKGTTGDKAFYAKWTPVNYTITYNTNDGSGTMTPTSYTIETATFDLPTPTKTGYTFAGWYTKSDFSDTKVTQIVKGTTGNKTFYAKWTANQYTITYKDQNNANFSGSHASGYPTKHTYGTATTLKDATKTGYNFGGWHTDQACTNKVTSLGATAYTADITLYAKWTINQYTLDFGAGEGGSVVAKVKGEAIKSPATLEHGTSVTLTATPEGENAFAQWVNEDGNKVSTTNPYTFELTGDITLKAEFSKPTTVYLKPSSAWKEHNAHFAIYSWGDSESWVEMQEVDCEGDYYKANIPAGFSDFAFVRLKPVGADDYSDENGGHNWENKWDQTGNLSVQTNGKNMYDIDDKTVSYIHLKPNTNWKSDEARFAAYFFGNGEKWVNLTKNGDVYTCKKPAGGYTKVIFCRMKKDVADNTWNNTWNKTLDLDLLSNGDQCFGINENDWGCDGNGNGNEGKGANGEWFRVLDDSQWKTFTTPTYDVTIKPTIHGTYSVVCNGRAYPVTYKEDVVIPNVPVGTVLTIQDVKPSKEAEYTSDIIYKESTNAAYQPVTDNQIIVCGNTTIDENFVTKNTHVVYLRIPNGLAWKTDEYQYLYAYDKLNNKTVPLTAAPNASNYEPGYTYYTCTIPKGTHTIRFEYHKSGNTLYQTHDFPHVMPLGSLNCYTIHSKEGETSIFNGYWSELLSNGDYRLLYVEQVVEKDQNNKTVITRKKAHPSNIIKKRTETGTDIVSLHVYNQNTYEATYKWENEETSLTYDSPSNSAVILQQYDGSKWVDIQHHMVFGPLETHVYTAMLPGRRNATAEDEPLVAQLKADYGIKAIINDTHEDKGNGVWNFPIKQTVNGGNTTIELMRKDVHRYTGEYYIRTDVANGGWFNYNPTNHMTRSDEARANSNFSHYYCKWVESDNNVNVKFTVANDFGYAISDTLEADRTDLWGVALANKMVGDNQTLPKNANVRFAWNEYSNFIHRAYIAGSAEVSDRFLVLEGDANIFDAKGNSLAAGVDNGTDPRFGLNANEEIFRDNSNWIYYADVQMKPMAPVKVTAKYDNHTQYFIGKQNETVTLLQGTGEEKYLIRMLYDFKTNQLISAYVPGASPDVHAISTNLMLIRQNNNEATQLIFNNETPSDMINIPTDRRAYGVIEFTEKRLINGKDDENKSLNEYEKSLYWISFPFNVDVSKAICFGEYGKHWIIQEYNGARRAAEGMWLDSETFWDYKWDQNITLKAGKGYVLALDVDQIASDGLFGLAGHRPIGIYFPSTEYISTAITEQTQVSTTVPAHVCTINRGTQKGDRRIADSHWNVIGVPSYVNAKGDYQLADIETQPEEVKYYYRWDGDFNDYTAMEKEGTKDFLSTHAYMVQFAGQINWQNIFNVNGVPKELAAKQSTDSEQEHRLRLELHQKGNKADHTFVRLQDEDGVTIRFDFNHDLCKVINAGANIYSVITAEESPVEVAANVMPIAETIIPVGVKITAAGEYTFRMPEGTDGIVVELIDYETNTRTNMLLDEYTINLEKGTFDNRFALHVKPSKVATSVDNIGDEVTGDKAGLRKFIIDGILYMQKDGVLYNAQGKLVR